MKKKSLSVLIAIALATATFLPASSVFAASQPATAAAPTAIGVTYDAHVQNIGWQNPWDTDEQEAGTDGQSLRMEAFKVKLTGDLPAGAKIQYQAHVQNLGWMDPVTDGAEAGTDGKSLRMEAIKINLVDLPGYTVKYKAHVQNIGWQDWKSDGEMAGTQGESLRMEALEIKVEKTDAEKNAEAVAENAVAKAEKSGDQADIDAANAAVANVKATTENTAFTARINAINAKFEVASATPVNGKQVVITFNKAVDPASVLDAPTAATSKVKAGTVTFTRTSTTAHPATDVTNDTADAKLSADGKTLTLTAQSGETFNGDYDISVKGATTVDDAQTVENYYGKFTMQDTTAPSVTGVVYNPTSDKFEVSLSEPVDSLTDEIVRINGVPVAGFDAISAPTSKLTISRGSVDFGTTAKIYVAGFKDPAGNLLKSYNGEVTVTKDTAALAVSSIKQVSNKVARVTFNKKLNVASDTAIKAGTGLVVCKADGSTTTNFTVAAAPIAVNPDGNAYDITFADAAYANNATTENFTVSFVKDAFTDVTGNTNGLYTTQVTLNKDVTAPTVTSTRLSKDGKSIEVTLSEDVAGGSINNQDVKLRKDGAELQSGTAGSEKVKATLKSGTTNVLEIATTEGSALNGDGTLKSGSYQVRFEDGAFTDLNGVKVVAVNAPSVTVAAAPVKTLTPVLAQGGANVFTVTAPGTQTFTTDSLTYTHFTVDGVAVPSNSDITLNPARTVITVKLPASGSSAISGNALFAVNGLTLESGTPLADATATLAVTDNTKPTLQSAKVVDNKHIILTYSEAVTPSAVNAGSDFAISQGGTALALASNELKATSVDGYPNEIELEVAQGTDVAPVVARIGTVTSSGAGTATIGGTYTGAADASYKVKVTAVDEAGKATKVEVAPDGSTYGSEKDYVAGMDIGNGLKLTITGTNAANDVYSFNATAAVAGSSATTLDLNKNITIVANDTSTVIKDLAGNVQAGSSAITVTK